VTKAERLFFIVNLFRIRQKITLSELTRECEVSERTIYRDLTSLSSINIPIYFDDGYQLAREISLPPLNFTEDEQELLGCCLQNSILHKSKYLKDKIKNIELKILLILPEKGKSRLTSHLHNNNSGEGNFSKREDDIIKCFIRALFERRALEIKFKIRGKKIERVMPRAINIKGDDWRLAFDDLDQFRSFEVSLKSLESIKILDGGINAGSD
jgi:predicted DNA-binding transcriptional regulator YafY